jgi:hypothetical protein
MPHRKIRTVKSPARETKAPFVKKKARLVRRAAHGALLAASFTAMQFFTGEVGEPKRWFDQRVVDNLQTPLTHYRE